MEDATPPSSSGQDNTVNTSGEQQQSDAPLNNQDDLLGILLEQNQHPNAETAGNDDAGTGQQPDAQTSDSHSNKPSASSSGPCTY